MCVAATICLIHLSIESMQQECNLVTSRTEEYGSFFTNNSNMVRTRELFRSWWPRFEVKTAADCYKLWNDPLVEKLAFDGLRSYVSIKWAGHLAQLYNLFTTWK